MQQSAEIDKLAAAIAKAQGQITNPTKNREVTVRTKTGGNYQFAYATLDNIFETIRQPLSENGLSFVQTLHTLDDGRLRLVTLLMHESGQWIRTETPVQVSEQGMQALGSAQTYARRYAISSLLGIAADEDDDANSADGNTVEKKTDRPTNGAAKGNGKTPPAQQAKSKLPDDLEAWESAALDKIAELRANGDLDGLNEWRGQQEQRFKDLLRADRGRALALKATLDSAIKVLTEQLAATAQAAE